MQIFSTISMLHPKGQKVKIACPPAPRSEDGSAGGGWGEECRAVRALKPRRSARTLGGRNRAEISLSFLEFFSEGARKRKIVRENFCEVAAGALAEAGGGAGQFCSKKVRAKDTISPPQKNTALHKRYFYVVEREGFEPKCVSDGISLNTARILSLAVNDEHDGNTRKIAVKISKSLNMDNRLAPPFVKGGVHNGASFSSDAPMELEGMQSPSSEGYYH